MKLQNVLLMNLIVSTVSYAEVVGIDEAWQGISAPEVVASGFTHRIDRIPYEGAINYNPIAWSGDYWASKLGGINYRWNSKTRTPFNYTSPSYKELRRYSRAKLEALSPAEKYDIYTGNYHYPLKAEVAKTVSPEAKDWEGICHGWAAASVHHAEPYAVDATNDQGITVPFGSSDIKALLSYYYAAKTDTDGTTYAGLRCNFGQWTGGRNECNQDLNAGAFHIIMGNLLGIKREGFIADLNRYDEVWNYPLVAYRTWATSGYQRASRTAARSAVWEIKMQTQVYYTAGTENDYWPVYDTDLQKFEVKDYSYTLEVDASGNIVGGEWISKERPDFIWKKPKVRNFEGTLSRLPELLLRENK